MERLQEILALLANAATIEDAQIAELEAELQDLYAELRAGDLTDEVIEALGQITEARESLCALAAERIAEAEASAEAEAAEAAAREQRLAELDAAMSAGDDDEDDPDGDDGEGGDGASDLDDELEQLLEDETVTAAGATPPAPAAPAAPRTAPMSDIRQRQPQRVHAQPRRHQPQPIRILASGAAGGEFSDRVALEDELLDRFERMRGSGQYGQVRIASFRTEYPSERTLAPGRVTDMSDYANAVRQAAFVGDQRSRESLTALMADGGLCAPVNVWYPLETVSQSTRSLRASMTQFNADRGGIRFNRPTLLTAIDTDGPGNASAAVGVITEAQDAAATFNKSCQDVECGDEVERRVDALWRCLGFGNFIARTNPERTSQFTDLSLAAYARFSEQRLFAAMVADATPVGGVQEFGALRDLLRNLNRAAVNFRARHRMPRTAPIRVDLPSYVLAMCQDDMTAALNSEIGMLDVTEAQINGFLATRNIRAVWFEDEFTTAQAGGAVINAYPATFTAVISHEGAHVYVDNGSLDIGVFRDSTLVADNKFRTFNEEFWTYAMLGVESLAATFAFCPNGASAGSLEPACGS